MAEDEDDYRTEVFSLDQDDMPFTVVVRNKDGDEVDRFVVEDAGVLEIPKYPVEGRPYTVKIIRNGESETGSENSFEGLLAFRFAQVPGR
jgi:hypothetical protein